ncbi:MAG TPA: SEC-C metal-binding domain-containing protein, partial [Candidatus Paceibacterota bacterium]|nr:SEC-C metal-binding domain-containing protein [Candidatus Paceibacterota bacterium]
EVIITESDAGQHAIDEQRRKKRAEEMAKYREEKEKMKEYLIKYKGIQRNETCPCGSGKKYKKCCLQDVEKKLQEYNLRF